MTQTISFNSNPDIFQNIVLVYMNEEEKRYIGNTYFYNGRTPDDKYLSIMYRDAMPDNMDVVMGWNWLDDNSANIVMVPEKTMTVGVEDFLAGHGLERDWKTIEFHVIEDYRGVDTFIKANPLKKGQLLGFGIKK